MNRTRTAAGVGTLLLVAVAVLAVLARDAPFSQFELQADAWLQLARSATLTSAALAVTACAQEAVGLAALAVGIIVLLVRRRRWDAARLFGMAGVAWALALIAKVLVARPRPPAELWLARPDSGFSFPSGHTTTAAVIVVIVIMVMRGLRARPAAVVVAVVFTLAVAVSRLYLGNHYPTDVVASCLLVAGAALLVYAIADLPAVRRAAGRLLRVPELVG